MAEAHTTPELNDDVTLISDSESSASTDVEYLRTMLRQRWELASVFNFLRVFVPLIGGDVKMSAEDIETALIEQNGSLAKLHIAILKGVVRDSKTLKDPDAWMVALTKTLANWWPWVGEGNFPLAGAKGKEIAIYKELAPTTRLLILKALCEVRVDQYDAVDFINEEIKNNGGASKFQKEKLVDDGNGISFWYDGDEVIGHRLYKEIHSFKNESISCTLPAITSRWYTLATNLEEFKKIMDNYSSSEFGWEVALSKALEANIIPVLEKQWKKKEKARLLKERELMMLNGFRKSGITRSCRMLKTVDYTFDDYDRAITKAIKRTNKRKPSEQLNKEEKQSQGKKKMRANSSGSDYSKTSSSNSESTESDAEHNSHSENEKLSEGKLKEQSVKENAMLIHRPKGSRFSKRLAGIPGHTIPESLNLGAKNRLRQRPSINTAAEPEVVPDSEDEKSAEEATRC